MYLQLHSDFESVFASDAWTTLGIKTFPENFQGTINATEFVRVGIYPADGVILDLDNDQIRGFARISIFTPSGNGEARAFSIASSLDTQFGRRTIGATQFFKSTINKVGLDSENQALWRIDYLIQFRTTS